MLDKAGETDRLCGIVSIGTLSVALSRRTPIDFTVGDAVQLDGRDHTIGGKRANGRGEFRDGLR